MRKRMRRSMNISNREDTMMFVEDEGGRHRATADTGTCADTAKHLPPIQRTVVGLLESTCINLLRFYRRPWRGSVPRSTALDNILCCT